MIHPPITPAIMPAKVPEKMMIRPTEASMSTDFSQLHTLLILNLANKNKIAQADMTPANK